MLNNKILFPVMFAALSTVLYQVGCESHVGRDQIYQIRSYGSVSDNQRRHNQLNHHSHSHESDKRPPPRPMKVPSQKVQIPSINKAAQRADLAVPQMRVVQKLQVQTTVVNRPKQGAVIGTQKPVTMTMKILIQRQNSLKTKIKTILMQQNITFEQNLDRDTFAALEDMIKTSNVKICEWLRQFLTITLNNYILRYYKLSNEESAFSASLPDDLNKEYHVLTKECKKIKKSAVGIISKLKDAEKTLYYKIVTDLFGQVKKKICDLMDDDGRIPEASTVITTPITTTAQRQVSKIAEQRAQAQFFTFAGQGFSVLPPEMLPTTTEDLTTTDQSKSMKIKHKIKKKRTITVIEMTQTDAARTSPAIKTATSTSTEKTVKISAATSETTSLVTTTSTSATTAIESVETSETTTRAMQKSSAVSAASIAANQEPETITVKTPDMAKTNEQQKALMIQIKTFVANNRARLKCDEKIDTEMISKMDDLFEQQSQEAAPSEQIRLIVKIILYHQLLKYYKSVIDASEGRVTMPKQLQEQFKIASDKFKCLEKDKMLDKSTLSETDQQIFNTINVYVFAIMKKKITTIRKTGVSNSGKIRIRISVQ